METRAKIVQGKYLDSVKLMLISKQMRELPGIIDAVAIMATAENMGILAATGMKVPEIITAKDNDIVIVAKAESGADSAMELADKLLNAKHETSAGAGIEAPAPSLETAIGRLGGADLCLISVAGKYAANEADKALDMGLHVMLFSDNVSIEDEARLKTKALDQGLLMMGPDCGTAIINGTPLAFANQVPRGNIGIVSASGTGLQEISVGIARMGCGVSQAFGTGGRDGKEEIGGTMLSACLDYLVRDPETKVIVLIGKTPDEAVLNRLWEQIARTGKPVIVNFLREMDVPHLPNMKYAKSLFGTAVLACEALTGRRISPEPSEGVVPAIAEAPRERHLIKGLYSGGTLCYEAIRIYKETFGIEPVSNLAKDPSRLIKDIWTTTEDSFIDLGDDDYTVGRPHPMIDFSLRTKLLATAGKEAEIAVILLDVVLGYGAHPDPAAELCPAIRDVEKGIRVICHVLGTDADPQGTEDQIDRLRQAGAEVCRSNEEAVTHALSIIKAQRGLS